MSNVESKLKTIFGKDYNQEYISRIQRLKLEQALTSHSPDFNMHPAFSHTSEKIDFLIDERIISFFKIAEDQISLALVLFNFSNEDVELRWSPDFPCDEITELLHDSAITQDNEELVFSLMPQQLQWVTFKKGPSS